MHRVVCVSDQDEFRVVDFDSFRIKPNHLIQFDRIYPNQHSLQYDSLAQHWKKFLTSDGDLTIVVTQSNVSLMTGMWDYFGPLINQEDLKGRFGVSAILAAGGVQNILTPASKQIEDLRPFSSEDVGAISKILTESWKSIESTADVSVVHTFELLKPASEHSQTLRIIQLPSLAHLSASGPLRDFLNEVQATANNLRHKRYSSSVHPVCQILAQEHNFRKHSRLFVHTVKSGKDATEKMHYIRGFIDANAVNPGSSWRESREELELERMKKDVKDHQVQLELFGEMTSAHEKLILKLREEKLTLQKNIEVEKLYRARIVTQKKNAVKRLEETSRKTLETMMELKADLEKFNKENTQLQKANREKDQYIAQLKRFQDDMVNTDEQWRRKLAYERAQSLKLTRYECDLNLERARLLKQEKATKDIEHKLKNLKEDHKDLQRDYTLCKMQFEDMTRRFNTARSELKIISAQNIKQSEEDYEELKNHLLGLHKKQEDEARKKHLKHVKDIQEAHRKEISGLKKLHETALQDSKIAHDQDLKRKEENWDEKWNGSSKEMERAKKENEELKEKLSLLKKDLADTKRNCKEKEKKLDECTVTCDQMKEDVKEERKKAKASVEEAEKRLKAKIEECDRYVKDKGALGKELSDLREKLVKATAERDSEHQQITRKLEIAEKNLKLEREANASAQEKQGNLLQAKSAEFDKLKKEFQELDKECQRVTYDKRESVKALDAAKRALQRELEEAKSSLACKEKEHAAGLGAERKKFKQRFEDAQRTWSQHKQALTLQVEQAQARLSEERKVRKREVTEHLQKWEERGKDLRKRLLKSIEDKGVYRAQVKELTSKVNDLEADKETLRLQCERIERDRDCIREEHLNIESVVFDIDRSWLDTREALRKENAALKAKLAELPEGWQHLQTGLEAAKQRESAAEKALEELQQRYEKLGEKVESLENERKLQRRSLAEKEGELERAEGELEDKQREVNEVEKRASASRKSLAQENAELGGKVSSLEDKLKKLRADKKKLQTVLDSQKSRLSDQKKELKHAQSEADQLKKQARRFQNELQKRKAKDAEQDERIKELEEEMQDRTLEEQNKKKEALIRKIQKEKRDLQKALSKEKKSRVALEEKEEKIKDLEELIAEHSQRSEKQQDRLKKSQKDVKELRKALNEAKANLEKAKELQERIRELEVQVADTSTEEKIQMQRDTIRNLQKESKDLRKALQAAKDEVMELEEKEEQVNELEQENGTLQETIKKQKSRLEKLKKDVKELQNSLEEEKERAEKLDGHTEKIQELGDGNAALKEVIKKQKDRIRGLLEDAKKLKKKAEDLKKQIQQKEKQLSKKEKSIFKLEGQVKEQQNKEASLTEKCAKVEADRKQLRSLLSAEKKKSKGDRTSEAKIRQLEAKILGMVQEGEELRKEAGKVKELQVVLGETQAALDHEKKRNEELARKQIGNAGVSQKAVSNETSEEKAQRNKLRYLAKKFRDHIDMIEKDLKKVGLIESLPRYEEKNSWPKEGDLESVLNKFKLMKRKANRKRKQSAKEPVRKRRKLSNGTSQENSSQSAAKEKPVPAKKKRKLRPRQAEVNLSPVRDRSVPKDDDLSDLQHFGPFGSPNTSGGTDSSEIRVVPRADKAAKEKAPKLLALEKKRASKKKAPKKPLSKPAKRAVPKSRKPKKTTPSKEKKVRRKKPPKRRKKPEPENNLDLDENSDESSSSLPNIRFRTRRSLGKKKTPPK